MPALLNPVPLAMSVSPCMVEHSGAAMISEFVFRAVALSAIFLIA